MTRLARALATLLLVVLGNVLAHWALIEAGREVVVLRTEQAWHLARVAAPGQ